MAAPLQSWSTELLSSSQGQTPLMQLSMEDTEVTATRPLAQLAGRVTLQGSHAGPSPVPAPRVTSFSTTQPTICRPPPQTELAIRGRFLCQPHPISCLCFPAIEWGQCHRPTSHLLDSFPCSEFHSFTQQTFLEL